MLQFISYTWPYLVHALGVLVVFMVGGFCIYLGMRQCRGRWVRIILGTALFMVLAAFCVRNILPYGLGSSFSLRTYGAAQGPTLPLSAMWDFFTRLDTFERVDDIARDPTDVPPPLTRTEPALVKVELTAKEVIAEMAPGVFVNYWTFDGTVPGPMIRVRVGDTVELTLHNDETSLHHHNIDLHAVTGPGGGAVSTMVAPGESATVTFKVLHPGLFVYHCATSNVAAHMTHGMYGLILVEPEEGLTPVDHEYYVMQGEYYAAGGMGRKGLQFFDAKAMIAGNPTYVFFNGKVNGLARHMNAKTGERIRMYVGNGGVNLTSSFHVIGEVFDRVFPEASLTSSPHTDVQTALVPAGGASVVEFDTQVPGNYVLVDHALARTEKGVWGILTVSGEEDTEIYNGAVIPGRGH